MYFYFSLPINSNSITLFIQGKIIIRQYGFEKKNKNLKLITNSNNNSKNNNADKIECACFLRMSCKIVIVHICKGKYCS